MLTMQLLKEGGGDENAKLTSKKRKRLDKFIAAKLRKEEKARLIAKLSKTSQEIGDRTELVSAATLGTGRATKEAERIGRMHRSEPRKPAAFQVEEDEQDRDLDEDEVPESQGAADDRESIDEAPEDLEEQDDEERVGTPPDEDERYSRIVQAARRFDGESQAKTKVPDPAPMTTAKAGTPAPSFGSALATGADGAPVAPVARKRRKKAATLQDASNMSLRERVRARRLAAKHSRDSDTSFDSSASSEDQDSDGEHDSPDGAAENEGTSESGAERMDDESDDDSEEGTHSEEGIDSEEGTDSDEEAVLMEAMRLRGMKPEQAEMNGHEEGGSEGGEDEEGEEEGEDEEDNGDEEEGSAEDESDEEDDDDDDDDDDEDGDDSASAPSAPRPGRFGIGESERSRTFKQWAQEALNLQRPEPPADDRPLEPVGGRVQRVRDLGPQDGVARGPLGEQVASPASQSPFAARFMEEDKLEKDGRRVFPIRHVRAERTADLLEARRQLPVVAEEDNIVRTIQENPVTVICGETGSGKTTQVPQFLYEAAYAASGSANPGMIGITQPRRVAALSMSRRVGAELGLGEPSVAYQIRYDATTSPHTRIKFMTDGVLLRELAHDLLLDKYSVVIIDEAHERSVNTDVLIGMLSRVTRLRERRWLEAPPGGSARPLRLVIMSATLRVSDFTQNASLFATPPPVLHIGARQHPVTVHFNRRTVSDYITEAVKKIAKVHTRLPPGGILVFLTGQQEVLTVCRKLRQKYGPKAAAAAPRVPEAPDGAQAPVSARVADVEAEEVELGAADAAAAGDVDEGHVDADPDALESESDEEQEADADLPPETTVPMHVLPLYSLLPSDAQQRVFEPPPEGTRLVVVATNVAETSITIPDIRYVVDAGRVKERRIDKQTQVQSYDVAWTSKASAAQRAGRAGRTGPGHCYRLYSSPVYEEVFAEFAQPEILRTPVDGLVLQMKAMNIDQVANFPFPTPPDRDALRRAERMLMHLGALEVPAVRGSGSRAAGGSVTELGRTMSLFPVAPRYAKLLAQGNQHGCLAYAVALVAALSVGDVFEREQALPVPELDGPLDEDAVERAKEARRAATSRFRRALQAFDVLGADLGDPFRLLVAVGAYEHDAARGNGAAFCSAHYVRAKAMDEIHKLRAQLGNLLLANLAGVGEKDAQRLHDPQLAPPNTVQCKVLRQLLTAAFVDRVAVRADVVGAPEAEERATGGKLTSTRGVPYVALGVPGAVYIHPSSALYGRPPPEWLVFGEVHQSAPKLAAPDDDTPPPRVWLKTLTRINPAWLATLGRTLCTFSQPVEVGGGGVLGQLAQSTQALKRGAQQSAVRRDVMLTPRYGGSLEDGAAGAGLGWELPSMRVTQELRGGRWETV